MHRLFNLLLFIALFLPSTVVHAGQYCSENWACAGNERDPLGVVIYWIENRKPFPITMTLYVDTHNYQSTEGEYRDNWEFTLVLKGHEKQTLVALEERNPRMPATHEYVFKWIPGDMDAVHDNGYQYHLPFADDKDYRVVQGFDGGYSHQGRSRYALDFAMPIGSAVHAARSGVVIDLKEHNWRGGASRRYAEYANYVVILHSDGTTGEYYHLKRHGAAVSLGDEVQVGQLIGYSGNTGFSSLPHLHFAVYRAKGHGSYESIPISFEREPNTWRRRGLGDSR